MKPYNIRKKFRYNYVDNHPKKGWVNWWEVEIGNTIPKSSVRFKIKKELNKLTLFNDK